MVCIVAGATLSKGLNRMFATFLGGLFAVGVIYVSHLAPRKAQPFIIGVAVFLISECTVFFMYKKDIWN